MRKLGRIQTDVLAALQRHGRWHEGCGWLWDTGRNTKRIMDSLVRAGVATSHTEETKWRNGNRTITVYLPAEQK